MRAMRAKFVYENAFNKRHFFGGSVLAVDNT
jgi:hypothetical protein